MLYVELLGFVELFLASVHMREARKSRKKYLFTVFGRNRHRERGQGGR